MEALLNATLILASKPSYGVPPDSRGFPTGRTEDGIVHIVMFVGLAAKARLQPADGAGMRKVLIVIGLIAVGVGGFWVIKTVTKVSANARTSKLNEDVENLFIALQQYKENVGSYPMGGNADIAKALMGKNPKNVIILVGRKNPTNDKGEFVDPWGSPLRIYFSDSGILIRSAGANRRFDDSTVLEADDYIRSN